MEKGKRGRGRPPGKDYEVAKSVRLGADEERLLKALSDLYSCSEAAVIRRAIKEMAKRERIK
jgi:hypothetical protein